MLSVFDLLTAGTLRVELAAYLMARISRGSSFMVGAAPGGAGKTTVMCALLNFAPAGLPLLAATPAAVHGAAEARTSARVCYVCHEIGSGSYFAYLWQESLRKYCGLLGKGHMLAANLHADDLEQARDQVCGDNGVPIELFNGFGLLIFLRMSGGWRDSRRWIEKVYSSDGSSGHRPVHDPAAGIMPHPSSQAYLADPVYVAKCRAFLKSMLAAGVRKIERTRRCVVDFLAENR